MEGYIYYLYAMSGDDVLVAASACLRDSLKAKSDLDDHLRLRFPLVWRCLDSRCDLATYKNMFFLEAPAKGSAAIENNVREYEPVD